VVLSAPTGAVTHLLIRCFGPVRHDVLVPLTGVEVGEGGGVRLRGPVAQLNRPAAADGGYPAAPPDPWAAPHGYEPDQVLFALADGADLLEEPTDAAILDQALATLQSYRSTRRLLQELESDEPVMANLVSDGTMRISVRHGVVILAGNVALHSDAGMVERLVRRVTGVHEVLNLLITDDDLWTSVAAALHYDPRTRPLQPGIGVALGQVTLTGSVADARSRDAVEAVAGAVPGVRGVVNRLRIGL
jgi:osmotically-inducible protein OsmY